MLCECVLGGDDGYSRMLVELLSRKVSNVFLNDWEWELPSRLGYPYTGGVIFGVDGLCNSLNHGDVEGAVRGECQ